MLAKNGLVEYVETNEPLSIVGSLPNDTNLSALWGLNNTGQTGGAPNADIDMPDAWERATGSSAVVVAVIDTGIDYTHPDLAENIWTNPDEVPNNGIDDDGNGFVDDVHGYDFFNHDADPRDDHFHGTHCAGTIGAVGNNATGVAGVNWSVGLMALKFLGANGSGNTDDAIAAVQYAINNGADVLSNSWGGSGYTQALQDAIRAARAAGLTVVAAAGNNGTDNLVYPAAYDGVIAVSATDHNDAKASFSSYGTFVDVAAPGVNIYSTDLGGGYRYASGTSMACPHVAGAAALLKSVDDSLTPTQIEALLETAADDLGAAGWDTDYGAGRINVFRALLAAEAGELAFPTAAMTAPANGQSITSASVQVRGRAGGDGFADYRVEFAKKGSADWQIIASSLVPVADEGLLATWDT
ncbi:MAG: S8 family serine peptidase, partial [Planctomycetes bacterium]|nr:S8 family serine peptidase [Planctomycetota bacterium]